MEVESSQERRIPLTQSNELYGRLVRMAAARECSTSEMLTDGVLLLANFKEIERFGDPSLDFTVRDERLQDRVVTVKPRDILACVAIERAVLHENHESWVTVWTNVPVGYFEAANFIGYPSVNDMLVDAMLVACNVYEPVYLA